MNLTHKRNKTATTSFEVTESLRLVEEGFVDTDSSLRVVKCQLDFPEIPLTALLTLRL